MDNIKATMIATYHLDRVLSSLVADQDGYLRYSHRLEKGHYAICKHRAVVLLHFFFSMTMIKTSSRSNFCCYDLCDTLCVDELFVGTKILLP